MAAILFLYREILDQPLPRLDRIEPAKRPVRLPAVFSEGEVQLIFSNLSPTKWHDAQAPAELS